MNITTVNPKLIAANDRVNYPINTNQVLTVACADSSLSLSGTDTVTCIGDHEYGGIEGIQCEGESLDKCIIVVPI